MSRPIASDTRGSALIEALVALVLIAIAGTVVASAAVAGLRATARGANLGRATALAGRELSALASRAGNASAETTTLALAGFPAPVQRITVVSRAHGVASVAVRIVTGRPADEVALETRVLVDESP